MLEQRRETEVVQHPMDIKFTNRLSYKQARLTVLVGFILGTLLSLLQIGIDYASEDASINREIQSLLEISHNPASRIAYNIDAELAQELTLGLLRSPAIIGAKLTDNNGNVLANVKRPGLQSGYRVLSDFLFGADRQFEDRLYLDHLPNESLGTLQLDVDTYSFGYRFLRRAEVTLLNGLARSLILSGILLALFYVMLTKPLVRLIHELSGRDSRSMEPTSLECPAGHADDEIGVLVKVANQQFENVATEIQQRRNAENRLTDYLGQLENIVSARTAELKAINARLSQSNQELETARSTALDMAEARSAFLANMSHEIRTPLNGLLGMIALSLDGPLNPEQQQQLSIAHDSGKVLVELLNDILDLSKFDAGQLELEHIPFDLASLIEDTANLLSQNAAPSVELTCLIEPQFPALVLGDPTRVRQIVSNLLSNALKFTRFGRVDVRLYTRPGGVRIEVSDTGIGIGPEQLERIFQGFTQAEASTTRRFGGTGLGLVICKRLVSLMDGELHVASEPGVGSRFWFAITLGVAQALPLRATCPGVDRSMRLLVVDDNEIAGDLLMRAVQSLGWQADLVNNGLQAVERVQQAQSNNRPYDVILMDWRMPVMDGLSAARLIHQQSAGRPAPTVIMVTAYGREVLADAQQDGDAPFAGFLSKPVTLKQLADTVERVLTDAVGPVLAVSPSARAEQPKRLAGMQLLVVEDNMLNRQVAFELLQGEGAHVTLAEGGLEGVRLATEFPGTFDAVLMDIQMPDIDGLEATRRIRASAQCAALPIVAMTANASSVDQQACFAAGMDGHVGKPIDLDVLVNSLLVHTGRESAPVETTVNDLDAIVESIDSISRRFGGNLDVIRSVLGSFAPEQEKQLVRLQESLERGDAASAAAVLHAIKGSSGTLGAQALSRLAGELEQQLKQGDEASKAQVLRDHVSIEQLRQLLLASVEQLQVVFALPAHGDAGSSPASDNDVPSVQWREALQEILPLLKTSNLQALERSEALLGQVPADQRPQFERFVVLVQSLDFAASLEAGHELLNSV